MTSVRFDHFITYTSAASIDDYLQEYAALGFAPEERTVRHDPGLRNGFVFIGPEYLEFCWVEDETLFETADEEDRLLRATPRPFGLGMVADDVQAVHDDWMARGFEMPDVSSGRPRDADPDTPPVWSFQAIPSELLPGAWVFALTYHLRAKDAERLFQVAPNTIYAISGVTFVTPEPEARATCWRNLLAPDEPIRQLGAAFSVQIGPHWAEWRTPGAYRSTYALDWIPHPLPHGELALLHLLATDVQAVKNLMEQAGRRSFPVSVAGGEALLVAPDVRDGFVFVVRQQPVETWLRERVGRTGERLKLSLD
jgi:hypothetical protein